MATHGENLAQLHAMLLQTVADPSDQNVRDLFATYNTFWAGEDFDATPAEMALEHHTFTLARQIYEKLGARSPEWLTGVGRRRGL